MKYEIAKPVKLSFQQCDSASRLIHELAEFVRKEQPERALVLNLFANFLGDDKGEGDTLAEKALQGGLYGPQSFGA